VSFRDRVRDFQFHRFIERINAATSTRDVDQTPTQQLGKFTDFLVTDMPPPDRGRAGQIIRNGWSQAWFERYMHGRIYSLDPMTRLARETVEPLILLGEIVP